MTLPFSLGTLPLPDWLPPWVPVVLMIPVVLWLLLLVVMPVAVLGTRSRLEGIEAQLDDLHAELRNLAMQFGPLGDHSREPSVGSARLEAPRFDAPRFEPSRFEPSRELSRADREVGRRGARSEPRIDWPSAADD